MGKVHGSAPAQPWPGRVHGLEKERSCGGEPPAKPSEGWESWRKRVEARLKAANQVEILEQRLAESRDSATCLTESVHA